MISAYWKNTLSKELLVAGINCLWGAIILHIIYNAENVGNSELMKVLLNNFDIKSVSEEERQKLLYKMIENGDYEIAKYLIDKGVSIGKDSKEYLEDCPVTKMKSLLEK